MSRVYLCRHAHAVDEAPHLSDEARYLSEKGRRAARAVGAAMRAHGVELDAVITSPLVRAVQTAELVALGLGWSGAIEAMHALEPGGSPRAAALELAERGQAVLVVGHEPGISALGAHLTERSTFAPFRKGEVRLVQDRRPVWRLDPETGTIGE